MVTESRIDKVFLVHQRIFLLILVIMFFFCQQICHFFQDFLRDLLFPTQVLLQFILKLLLLLQIFQEAFIVADDWWDAIIPELKYNLVLIHEYSCFIVFALALTGAPNAIVGYCLFDTLSGISEFWEQWRAKKSQRKPDEAGEWARKRQNESYGRLITKERLASHL